MLISSVLHFSMTFDLPVNAYSRQNFTWLIFRKSINLIIAYHIRWQDCQECTMLPSAPPPPRCKFALNIVNYRPPFKHFRYRSPRIGYFRPKSKMTAVTSAFRQFFLRRTISYLRARLTWDRSKISKLDTRKRVRWDRAGILDGSKQTSSKICFYIVNYRSRWCKDAYLIIEMSNLNEGIK